MDHLARLALDAHNRVKKGYYDNLKSIHRSHRILSKAIRETSSNAIIAEIKFSSPSLGKIRETGHAISIADSMVRGGACAISVLTEPDNFGGGLTTLAEVAAESRVPVVMKDIIITPTQLKAGSRAGADAVVIVSEVFSRNLATVDLKEIIREAGNYGLEVLVESHDLAGFLKLKELHPDLYGINNRDLSTLRVELSRTEDIISEAGKVDGLIVSESGIDSPYNLRRLRNAGAHAFLIGTSIMQSTDVEVKVRELVNA